MVPGTFGDQRARRTVHVGRRLAVATYLHAFVRHANIVKMANLAQLVNVIAPIVTKKTASSCRRSITL